MPRDYRKLNVWRKSHELVLSIYASTRGFPTDELYGLTSQMRRSAASIPTNIAEGCGRGGDKELVRFMNIAQGSASELSYQLYLAGELQYMGQATADELSAAATEVARMLNSYTAKLKS